MCFSEACQGRGRPGTTQRPAYLELVAITLARVHSKTLDDLARATGADSAALLDAAEIEVLEAL